MLAILLATVSACEGKKSDNKNDDEEPAITGAKPVVEVETSMGSFKIELFQEQAPITVKNFLTYVDAKHYDGTIFHRVIEDFMIQGGGMEPGMKKKSTNPPIKNEAGNRLRNLRGRVAMARTGDPDSATDQFFICVVDKSHLNRTRNYDPKKNPEGAGYAVFGQVIEGMDVVDKIKKVEVANRGDHQAVPVVDVVIHSIRRVDK